MRDLLDHFLKESGKNPDLPKIFEALSFARHFNVSIMKEVLEQLEEWENRDITTPTVIGLIGSMIASGLAKQSDLSEGYEIDQTLRQMLAEYFHQSNKERSRAAHTLILDYYRARLTRPYPSRVFLVSERLYQKANLLHLDHFLEKNVLDILKEQLQADLNAYFIVDDKADIAACINLQNRIDADAELLELLGEVLPLKEMIYDFMRMKDERISEAVQLIIDRDWNAPEPSYEMRILTPHQSLQETEKISIGQDWPELEDIYTILQTPEADSYLQGWYNLGLSRAVQDVLRNTQALPLQIQTNDPRFPWELLHDGENYLCRGRPVGKIIFREHAPVISIDNAHPAETVSDLDVLLVINPTEDLPHTEKEGKAILELLLENGVSETRIKMLKGAEATREQLSAEIGSGKYDIIHFAGHGEYEQDDPRRSRLKLAKGTALQAEEFGRILRGRPVIFLNACQSGVTAVGFEGFARECLQNGALACIGALWDVKDEAASKMATTFYTGIIKNHPLGESMMKARQALQDEAITDWGAYVLYSNFRLKLF